MSLISRIFTSPEASPSSGPGTPDVTTEISIETLKQLIPIRNIEEDQLNAFASEVRAEIHPAGSVLFKSGDNDDTVLYLLDGSVEIGTDCGQTYTIDADSAKARFPLSSGRQHTSTARSQSRTRVLRVSSRIMASSDTPDTDSGFASVISRLKLPPEIRENRLFEAFCQHFSQDEPNLPTLPDVAQKLRRAVAQDQSLEQIVKIVQLDTSIAAKLVQVANSPLYLARNPVKNCREAVLRLGLNATRNLVTSISIKHLMRCKDREIRQRMKSLWKQNANLSCLCFVLASETRTVNPEDALLAGLVSDIGLIPFLQFADNFPSELSQSEDLDLIAPIIRGPAGAFLLQRWDFAEEFITLPELAENWYYPGSDQLDLADIVILSKLHSYIGTPRMAELPPINSIPACSKLKDGTLSPEHSLNVLHNAKDRIRDTMSIFST